MADRRQEILVTAYGILGTKGLEELHARTVATALGVNHATVHYYFRRRSDLLAGVADYTLQVMQDDRARFCEGATTARANVESELELAEAYCRRQSRFFKVLAGLYVAGVNDPVLRKKLKAIWTAWVHGPAQALPGARAKAGSPFADPELFMATVFGIGLASHMLEGGLSAKPKLDAVARSLFG